MDLWKASYYTDDCLPYARNYENLTQEELATLIADARRNRWDVLSLRKCGLESLPDVFGDLPDLRVLAIGNSNADARSLTGRTNTFTYLPESLGELVNLQVLILHKCHIRELPKAIGQLKNLKVLRLDESKIYEIPDSIRQLSNLQYLDLSDCHLKEIPYALVRLGLPFVTNSYDSRNCINLTNTKLDEMDISLFSQSREIIEEYYQGNQTQTVNECKVIFLGDGAAGKSSIIERIVNGGFRACPKSSEHF